MNLRQAWDGEFGAGAWASLEIDKLYFTIGNWCLSDAGSRNDTWYDAIVMKEEQSGDISSIDGTPLEINDSVFHTEFGTDTKSKANSRK